MEAKRKRDDGHRSMAAGAASSLAAKVQLLHRREADLRCFSSNIRLSTSLLLYGLMQRRQAFQ